MNDRYVLLGEKYREILEYPLISRGFMPLFIPENPYIDNRLSAHADLSVFYAGGMDIFCAPYLREHELTKKLSHLDFEVHFIDILQTVFYPHDAQLNICLIGDSFFYNPRSASEGIVSFLTNHGKRGIPVRQGYTGCSVCPVSDYALITGDRGISEAARRSGFDVLEIENGHIALEGFEYGFIGGAAFDASEGELYFTGRIDGHPNKAAILAFLEKHSVRPIFLTELPLFDIGSVISLYR